MSATLNLYIIEKSCGRGEQIVCCFPSRSYVSSPRLENDLACKIKTDTWPHRAVQVIPI